LVVLRLSEPFCLVADRRVFLMPTQDDGSKKELLDE